MERLIPGPDQWGTHQLCNLSQQQQGEADWGRVRDWVLHGDRCSHCRSRVTHTTPIMHEVGPTTLPLRTTAHTQTTLFCLEPYFGITHHIHRKRMNHSCYSRLYVMHAYLSQQCTPSVRTTNFTLHSRQRHCCQAHILVSHITGTVVKHTSWYHTSQDSENNHCSPCHFRTHSTVRQSDIMSYDSGCVSS